MADFPYKPDLGYKKTPEYNTITKRYANNIDQVRLVSTQKLRKFSLSFTSRSTAEKEAVEDFYDTKQGATTIFTIDIDGETISGRFVEGTLDVVRQTPVVYDYSFQFQEVIT